MLYVIKFHYSSKVDEEIETPKKFLFDQTHEVEAQLPLFKHIVPFRSYDRSLPKNWIRNFDLLMFLPFSFIDQLLYVSAKVIFIIRS